MAVPDVTARPAQQPTLSPTSDVDPFFRELLAAMAEVVATRPGVRLLVAGRDGDAVERNGDGDGDERSGRSAESSGAPERSVCVRAS